MNQNVKAYKLYWLIDTLEATILEFNPIAMKQQDLGTSLDYLRASCTRTRKMLDKIMKDGAEDAGLLNDELNEVIDLILTKKYNDEK